MKHENRLSNYSILHGVNGFLKTPADLKNRTAGVVFSAGFCHGFLMTVTELISLLMKVRDIHGDLLMKTGSSHPDEPEKEVESLAIVYKADTGEEMERFVQVNSR